MRGTATSRSWRCRAASPLCAPARRSPSRDPRPRSCTGKASVRRPERGRTLKTGEGCFLTLLGVDIGTTHVKACAYDEEGRFLGASRRGTATSRSRGGGAEYDACAVECAVFEVIRRVAERFEPPRAIGVSS